MTKQELDTAPFEIDTPEAYEASQFLYRDSIILPSDFIDKEPSFTEEQQELVKREARLFGVSPNTSVVNFVDAHRKFFNGAEADINESLVRVKETLIGRIADYFAEDDELVRESLIGILTSRLEATNTIEIDDTLASGNTSAGHFDFFERQPYIALSEIVELAERAKDKEEYNDILENVVLAHELLHGVFTGGFWAVNENDFGIPRMPARNGLQITHHTDFEDLDKNVFKKQGTWLNEAVLESFRREVMQTEQVRYEPDVMVLQTLEELDHGLRDELLLTAFDRRGPGPAFGRIEMLLGPTGIEEVQQLCDQVDDFPDLPGFREAVVNLMPEEMRERAAEIILTKERQILGSRQRYIEEVAKQRGAVALK